MLFIGCLLVIVSLVNLIPLAGDVTSIIAGGLMAFYLYQKGLKGTSTIATNVVGYLCGLVPILQAIPTELLAWVVTVIIDRNPKIKAVAATASKLEGKEGEGGAAPGAPLAAPEQAIAGAASPEGVPPGAAPTEGGVAVSTGPAAGGGAQAETAPEEGGGAAPEEGEERGGEKAGETKEEAAKAQEIADIFQPMESPQEQAEREVFNPPETEFHEARSLGERPPELEGGGEGKNVGEGGKEGKGGGK